MNTFSPSKARYRFFSEGQVVIDLPDLKAMLLLTEPNQAVHLDEEEIKEFLDSMRDMSFWMVGDRYALNRVLTLYSALTGEVADTTMHAMINPLDRAIRMALKEARSEVVVSHPRVMAEEVSDDANALWQLATNLALNEVHGHDFDGCALIEFQVAQYWEVITHANDAARA